MTENLEEKLHQGKRKQSKGAEFVPVLDENLIVKNAAKFFAKYLEDKIFKIKIIQNILVKLSTFLTLISIN